MLIFLEGRINSGKTTFVLKAAGLFMKAGVSLGGFYALKRFACGRRIYSVRGFDGSRPVKLLSVSQGDIKISKRGFARASRLLALSAPRKLVIIDEFGPIEVSGGGHFRSVKRLLKDPGKTAIIVVRKGLASSAARALKAEKYSVVAYRRNLSAERFVSRIAKCLQD